MKTNELQKKLEALKLYLGKDNAKAKEQIELIKKQFSSKEDIEVIDEFIRDGLNELTNNLKEYNKILSVRSHLEKDIEILPLSYIAEKYFKKTRNWLYQKINGNIVNGKPASFNDKEKDIFNSALKDLSNRIGAIQI